MAARRPPAPSFDRVERLADQAGSHALRVWSLLRDIENLGRDDVPNAQKIEVARILLAANVAERLRRLLDSVRQLNDLLRPELAPSDEAWLRRQLDGLGEKGGA